MPVEGKIISINDVNLLVNQKSGRQRNTDDIYPFFKNRYSIIIANITLPNSNTFQSEHGLQFFTAWTAGNHKFKDSTGIDSEFIKSFD